VRSGQLPKDDDGVSCMLLRLPKGWGPPRLQAFIERFGAKPASVSKNAGAGVLLRFAHREDYCVKGFPLCNAVV
jgi:hypothetical protein